MGKLFGTDGVRGVANKDLIGELAFDLGRAGAYVLTKERKHTPRILVAMDTRISGDMLESALVSGICAVGATAVIAGVIPTPAVAYLVRKYNLDAGVMISASHNPVEYNGIKFFNREGYKLPDSLEDEIEDLIFNNKDNIPVPLGNEVGKKAYAEDALDDYISFLCSTTKEKFSNIKVALDCANGAAYKVAPLALLDLDARMCIIHNEPDGTNINENCGSTHMGDLADLIVNNGADVGFAFDGDADRCLAMDEKGNLIDGDKILAVCAKYMMENDELSKNTMVGTVMANLGLTHTCNENNINLEKTKVGDRYVLEKMLEDGYNLGGEQSGHIIFLDYNTTGDGVLTAIKFLTVMKKTGKKASELAEIMQVLPQVLINATVDNAKKELYMEDAEVRTAIESLEKKFSKDGRVLIRTSGTEPLVRVMIEGKDLEVMEIEARKLADLIESKLG